MSLLTLTPADRERLEALRPLLPRRIIDAHAHLWKREHHNGAEEERGAGWPLRVAADNPAEDLAETYRLLLPDSEVTPLVFGYPGASTDIAANNSYVEEVSRERGWPALYLSHPDMEEEELLAAFARGFLGLKPYFSYAPDYLPEAEIRIYDFLPHRHLRLLDRLGLTVMLHIPRPGRLRDPVNLRQLLEIEQTYPNLQLIVAHVGRAYVEGDLDGAFQYLAPSRRMVFDFSANTLDTAILRAVQAVGPSRILFGSDLPIARMRMRRIERNGSYLNLVPRGLYGDVTGDPHMREIDPPEADALSLFFYESILASLRALAQAGLSPTEMDAVYYGNAARLLSRKGERR